MCDGGVAVRFCLCVHCLCMVVCVMDPHVCTILWVVASRFSILLKDSAAGVFASVHYPISKHFIIFLLWTLTDLSPNWPTVAPVCLWRLKLLAQRSWSCCSYILSGYSSCSKVQEHSKQVLLEGNWLLLCCDRWALCSSWEMNFLLCSVWVSWSEVLPIQLCFPASLFVFVCSCARFKFYCVQFERRIRLIRQKRCRCSVDSKCFHSPTTNQNHTLQNMLKSI